MCFLAGAIALAEYLADNAKIVRLDLRENDIRTGGLMALSLAMKVNKILLRLDLDKDIKRDSVSDHDYDVINHFLAIANEFYA